MFAIETLTQTNPDQTLLAEIVWLQYGNVCMQCKNGNQMDFTLFRNKPISMDNIRLAQSRFLIQSMVTTQTKLKSNLCATFLDAIVWGGESRCFAKANGFGPSCWEDGLLWTSFKPNLTQQPSEMSRLLFVVEVKVIRPDTGGDKLNYFF